MMRIIRFLADDGRILLGEDQGDGAALMLIEPQAILDADPIAASLSLLEGSTALVADDDENMRKIMATVLSSIGCRCLVAVDGEEAMRIVEGDALDLVVTDIKMPGHDGYEIFAAARECHGRIPVLLVTGFGYDPTHSLVRASAEGHSSVLYKPFTPRQLREGVCAALQDTIEPIGPFLPTGRRATVRRVMTPLAPARIVVTGEQPANEGNPAAATGGHELKVMIEPTGLVLDPGQTVPIASVDAGHAIAECRGDLAVIIGEAAENVSEEEALQYVLGCTVANRILVRPDSAMVASSSSDEQSDGTFCVLGPCVLDTGALPAGEEAVITTFIDGAVVQTRRVPHLRESIGRFVHRLSRQIALEPGMTIMAAAALQDGDSGTATILARPGSVISVEITGIGRLTNRLGTAAAPVMTEGRINGASS